MAPPVLARSSPWTLVGESVLWPLGPSVWSLPSIGDCRGIAGQPALYNAAASAQAQVIVEAVREEAAPAQALARSARESSTESICARATIGQPGARLRLAGRDPPPVRSLPGSRAAAGSPAGAPGSGRRPASPPPARPLLLPHGCARAGCARSCWSFGGV